MRSFEIGVVLITGQYGPDRVTVRWSELRSMAVQAEALGFDTVWSPDELVWRLPKGPPEGFWDGVAMAGAIAAVTPTVAVGTWVMSALHRNAGIIAKAAETLDEISAGRFVFGLGAGHAWPGQARTFGLPEDHIFDRFEDALQVIVPLLRDGRADHEGRWHIARDLPQVPVGPRPGRIPLMIGGNGPRAQRLAVRHAEIWSGYPDERSHVDEYRPRLESLEAICAELGRDPTTIGRSAGVQVKPLERGADPSGAWITGDPEAIADAIRSFREAGCTRVEIMLRPCSVEALDALGPVLERVRTD